MGDEQTQCQIKYENYCKSFIRASSSVTVQLCAWQCPNKAANMKPKLQFLWWPLGNGAIINVHVKKQKIKIIMISFPSGQLHWGAFLYNPIQIILEVKFKHF